MPLRLAQRDEVFKASPAIAHALYDWQQETYGARDDYQAGDDIFLELDDDEPTTLTQELADQFNAEEEAWFANLMDPFAEPPEAIVRHDSLIAETRHTTMVAFCADIGGMTWQLCKAMGWPEFAILPFWRAPYRAQNNDYPDAVAADQALAAIGVDKEYTGAIVASGADLEMIVPAVFKIARYNASAPYIAATPPGSSCVFTFCQRANFHMDCYDADEWSRVSDSLVKADFVIAKDGLCEERLDDEDLFEGRRIDLS